MELPIRATLMSTIMSIPIVIIGGATLYASPNKEVKAYTIYTLYSVMNLFRSPVTVTSLFRSNQYNQALDRVADRERRRQVVIAHARKNRMLKLEQYKMDFLNTIAQMEKESHSNRMAATKKNLTNAPNPLTEVHM